MTTLEKTVQELFNKSIKDCSDEEIYISLLKLTKDSIR